MVVLLEAQFVERPHYPKRNPKSLRNFLEKVNWDEGPCPPGCKINHDEKWEGITLPLRKTPQKVSVRVPQIEVLPGAQDPTPKDLERHRNLFGESPELYEVAELYGIELKVRKPQ